LDQDDGIRGLCEADRRFDLKETRFSAEDVAVYVRPNREAEFAETIAQLMAQPELRKKVGTFGRRRVENELQWNRVGKNLPCWITSHCYS